MKQEELVQTVGAMYLELLTKDKEVRHRDAVIASLQKKIQEIELDKIELHKQIVQLEKNRAESRG